jgi:hypothetical protein
VVELSPLEKKSILLTDIGVIAYAVVNPEEMESFTGGEALGDQVCNLYLITVIPFDHNMAPDEAVIEDCEQKNEIGW